uniref:PHD finger protein 24 n=1 Tax=Pseudonaja textilis TaxID=8673 RepID=A0A670Z6P0_PSETE
MGVLMSRRQTVEQVQKVSLAVSAFKDGLRERPAAKRPAEGAAGRRGTLEEHAVRELREEEAEAEEKEKAAAPGGASRPGGGGTRSAAWARLRDGRGVEPEDLDRPGCFTPPALVRPVRGGLLSDHSQPAFPLQVTNDEMCEVCEVWTADSLLACRVCTKVYHDGCLQRMGLLSPAEPAEAIQAAHSEVGWSCYHCGVGSALGEARQQRAPSNRDLGAVPTDSSLSLEDFLRYKGLGGQPSSQEEEERHAQQFRALDPGQEGRVAWTDFLSHESLMLLQRTRTQEGLLYLLTGKERERAREAFLALNQHGDGLISQDQSRPMGYLGPCGWLRNVFSNKNKTTSQESPLGTLTLLVLCFAPSRTVTWPAFLRENTAYILAARPNSAAIHLKPLM